MKKILLLTMGIGLAFLQSLSANAEDTTPTFCSTQGQVVVFNCELDNGGLVSVCANNQLSLERGDIVYVHSKEIGRPADLQVEGKRHGNFVATYKLRAFAAGGATSLIFPNAEYRYIIFSGRINPGTDMHGISVEHFGKLIQTNYCKSAPPISMNKMDTEYFEKVGMRWDYSGLDIPWKE